MKYIEKIKVLSDSNYKKEVARYLWFVLKGDGSVWTGYEDRDDAKEELKELKETDKEAKMLAREKVEPTTLAQFFKGCGVPQALLDKGYRDAKQDAKLARSDPWAYEAKKDKESEKERAKAEKKKAVTETKGWKLFNKNSKEIKVGDKIEFKGQQVTVTSLEPPHKPGASGYVTTKSGRYYATVYDVEFKHT